MVMLYTRKISRLWLVLRRVIRLFLVARLSVLRKRLRRCRLVRRRRCTGIGAYRLPLVRRPVRPDCRVPGRLYGVSHLTGGNVCPPDGLVPAVLVAPIIRPMFRTMTRWSWLLCRVLIRFHLLRCRAPRPMVLVFS